MQAVQQWCGSEVAGQQLASASRGTHEQQRQRRRCQRPCQLQAGQDFVRASVNRSFFMSTSLTAQVAAQASSMHSEKRTPCCHGTRASQVLAAAECNDEVRNLSGCMLGCLGRTQMQHLLLHAQTRRPISGMDGSQDCTRSKEVMTTLHTRLSCGLFKRGNASPQV